jgi:hypothetical protein
MRVSFNPACIFAALLGATVGAHAADLGMRYPVAPVAPVAPAAVSTTGPAFIWASRDLSLSPS